ncbi:MAG: transcription-repair coupling factor [Saprospiraceae bacterium]|nr:transcription-repair coupling factor [Bacteroidia bacterium]NNE13451.1 transcription-repair coupling factor [Saprospiraceae bacterium]NNL93820.1 transcription-repair coupling factor [Saprospiraceae bacterium]
MSNLEGLLAHYKSAQQTQEILDGLNTNKPSRLLLDGIVGALDCFVFSAIFYSTNSSHVIIASDKEEAAYIQNTLDQFVKEQTILFFPDSFKRPAFFEDIDNNNVLIRTESINKINAAYNAKEVLVTYPEAIFEKVVDPQYLESQKITIAKNETLDVDTIIEVLVGYGFERTDFVYEPGQFSIRGGIVDIFSFGNEWPYRVELFDDEVESIRLFNPTTQLSLKNIARVSIIPNISNQFGQEQKVSLFNVFKESTTVWIKDLDLLVDTLVSCEQKAAVYAEQVKFTEDVALQKLLDERAFILPSQIIQELEMHNIILFNKGEKKIVIDDKIQYNAKPQPTFNKNFKLLIDDLEQKKRSGTETYLFTDNNRQIERFYNIFEDLGTDLVFHPVVHSIHAGFIDKDLKVACYTDHQIFERFHRYKLKKGFTKEQALNLRMIRELRPGDFVTHIDHGIGKYSGLEKLNINGQEQESIRLIYLNNDVLYVGINSLHKISRYIGKDGTAPKLSKIGGEAWKNLRRKTKRQIKDIAKELIKLYAQRRASKGFAFPEDNYLQNELEASFIYEDTPDQYDATIAVKEDMQKEYPMDRLICGDVGFGKTEVAIRAAFKAVLGGKQVGILVPTTILALQHYKTFKSRLEPFGVDVNYVNRFRTSKEKKLIYKQLEEGNLDLIIGTHALLSKDVKFKDLGLLVIDEEQKFGVAAKEKLRKFKVNVDTLTLTATPIPRTLQFSLMAARDLSLIKTPPPNRQPIHTERRVFNDALIKDAIYYEFMRGGQVFFVHNRVKSLPDITAMIKRVCPDLEVRMAHGQMDSKDLEKTLISFIEGKYDVLVCTNIIETGLDIPNANTIIINNAHHFGLSDLHQLRGRVGRSNKKAYCYLFSPPSSTLTSEARKRLKTIEEFSDLGSGFHIAMRDLDIRGAGNLLGGEQSGFIADIGYETYQKILEEAIHELKETEFKELFKDEKTEDRAFVHEVEVDADIEMLIPDDYINIIQERLSIYTEMGNIEKEETLIKLRDKLKDKFGPIPYQVDELFNGIRLRWICKRMGIERLSLKSRKLRCYFVGNPQSSFYETPFFGKFINFISTKGPALGLSIKQSKSHLILIKDGVNNLKTCRRILESIESEIT